MGDSLKFCAQRTLTLQTSYLLYSVPGAGLSTENSLKAGILLNTEKKESSGHERHGGTLNILLSGNCHSERAADYGFQL
jgi:hypothetical protein